MDQPKYGGLGDSMSSIYASLPLNNYYHHHYAHNYRLSATELTAYYSTFNAYTFEMLTNQASAFKDYPQPPPPPPPLPDYPPATPAPEVAKSEPKRIRTNQLERRRDLANKQERKRMHKLNDALNRLREIIPNEPNCNRKMSKIKTLQTAIGYIRELQRLLDS